jgi:hypothetical protein
VILSSHSIGSACGEEEVTTAFEEERKRGKTVLFPVRLDGAVMGTCIAAYHPVIIVPATAVATHMNSKENLHGN